MLPERSHHVVHPMLSLVVLDQPGPGSAFLLVLLF